MREKNRYHIKTLIELIIFCGRQEIALRGHDESDESENRGNFLELIEIINRHDPKFAERLRSLPDNVTYLSPTFQNEMANCISRNISDVIVKSVEESGMFSSLVDDTKDISVIQNICQLYCAILINPQNQSMDFNGIFQTDGLDAQSLVNCMTTALNDHISFEKCIAQSYDGASLMNRDKGWVKKKIQEIIPHAIYVHCYVHRVNLVLVDVCKKEPIARDFFELIQSLYVYMSSAIPHAKLCATQAVLHPGGSCNRTQTNY